MNKQRTMLYVAHDGVKVFAIHPSKNEFHIHLSVDHPFGNHYEPFWRAK
jgi:hypothetical protein